MHMWTKIIIIIFWEAYLLEPFSAPSNQPGHCFTNRLLGWKEFCEFVPE